MFVLCMIVFTLLASLSITMIAIISKQALRLIRSGAEDVRIYEEYQKQQKKKQGKTGAIIDTVISVFCCGVFLLFFAFSVYIKVIANDVTGDIPVIRVVQSNSMEKKYEENEYLFENNLNDQFSTFDLILTHKLPDEFDLQLYDIVVYEVDDTLVVHRIVQIEEPNESHPNERYFRLQGDNVHIPDKFPVKYSQMKAIYRGERVPYIGSFVAFMQSPAGTICAILIIFAVIVAPIVDKRIEKERMRRLQLLLQGLPIQKEYANATDRPVVLPDGGILGEPTTSLPIPIPVPVPYPVQTPVYIFDQGTQNGVPQTSATKGGGKR